MISDFQEFLNELAVVLGFPLQPDDKGACLILMKQEEVPLLFEFDESLVPNTILISSEISPISEDILSAVLEEALIANHSMSETLSCRPDSNFLYLHKRVHPKIAAADLKIIVEPLVKQVTHWRGRVQEIQKSPPDKKVEAPPSFKMHQFKV